MVPLLLFLWTAVIRPLYYKLTGKEAGQKSETDMKEGPSEKPPVPGDQAKTDTNMLRSVIDNIVTKFEISHLESAVLVNQQVLDRSVDAESVISRLCHIGPLLFIGPMKADAETWPPRCIGWKHRSLI